MERDHGAMQGCSREGAGGAQLWDFSYSRSNKVTSKSAQELLWDVILRTIAEKKHLAQKETNWKICLGTCVNGLALNW